MLRIIKRILLSILAGLLLSAVLVIAFQEAVLFPGVLFSTRSLRGDLAVFPENVEGYFLKTADGEDVEVWRMPGEPSGQFYGQGYVAAVFHGNGGSIEYFSYLQQFFATLGVTSYAIDFRGYGRSSGWPWEEAILSDADELWLEIKRRENVDPAKLLILGYSIGTGPATYLAEQLSPAALMLIAPYASIPKLLENHEFWSRYAFIFRSFLRVEFNNESRVSKLVNTSLFITHGTADTIVPTAHSHLVEEAYRGEGTLKAIYPEGAGHGDVFHLSESELTDFLQQVLER